MERGLGKSILCKLWLMGTKSADKLAIYVSKQSILASTTLPTQLLAEIFAFLDSFE
jgi:hypothetical protein